RRGSSRIPGSSRPSGPESRRRTDGSCRRTRRPYRRATQDTTATTGDRSCRGSESCRRRSRRRGCAPRRPRKLALGRRPEPPRPRSARRLARRETRNSPAARSARLLATPLRRSTVPPPPDYARRRARWSSVPPLLSSSFSDTHRFFVRQLGAEPPLLDFFRRQPLDDRLVPAARDAVGRAPDALQRLLEDPREDQKRRAD